MAQPSGGSSKEPSRRQSTSILTAWRNLTSSKTKSHGNAHPAALTNASARTYKAGISAEAGYSVSRTSKDHDGTHKLVDEHPDSSSADLSDSPPEHEVIVGGPPELRALLATLEKSDSLSERTQAARKISRILHKYTISNAGIICTWSQDLLDSADNAARQAGFHLLLSCVRGVTLTAAEKLQFFDCAQQHTSGSDFTLGFEAIQQMTDDGKDIEVIAPFLVPFLVATLQERFRSLSDARKRGRKESEPGLAHDEEGFATLLHFINNVVHFSAKSLTTIDVARLLDQFIENCKVTTAATDIENAMTFINNVITYSTMSPNLVRPCLTLLSDVARQLANLRDEAWNVMENLFKSHLGHFAITVLSATLFAPNLESYSSNNVRGAFYVLRRLVKEDRRDGLPQIPMSMIISGVSHVVGERNDPKFLGDTLRLYAELLTDDSLTKQFLDEIDWTVSTEIIVRCVNTFVTSQVKVAIIDGLVRAVELPEQHRDPKSTELDAPTCVDLFYVLTTRLCALFPELDYVQKEAVIGLFLRLPRLLDDNTAEVLITYCIDERLIYPSNDRWLQVSATLITTFLQDPGRATSIRIGLVSALKKAYPSIETLPDDIIKSFVTLVLEHMRDEQDTSVMDAIASFAVVVAPKCSMLVFDHMLETFRPVIFAKKHKQDRGVQGRAASPPQPAIHTHDHPSLCRVAAKHIIRLFISSVNVSAEKAETLFDFILAIAGSDDCVTDARICAVKLLFRLRTDSNFAIWIRPLSESESLAAVLCRTAETAVTESATEDTTSSRDTRVVSGSGAHGTTRRMFNVKTPVPPLWFYPGPKGLPEEPPIEASAFVYSFLDPELGLSQEGCRTLKFNRWLETILSLIQQPGVDWEIYSYVLVHLGAQLSNHNLFKGTTLQIQLLRSVLCDQIRTSSFHEPPGHTSLKRADVAICVFHILTVVVSYKAYFADSEEDEIVRSFQQGIGTWDGTTKWCIHALTVCCHELPRATSKGLPAVINKLVQVITQPGIAIHILEFLTSLARQPEMYRDLHEQEFRQIFAVSFRYLEHVRDQRAKGTNSQPSSVPPSRAGKSTVRNSSSFRDLQQQVEQDRRSRQHTSSDELPQYVYALAYHVIAFWFMALKLEERPFYQAIIVRGLTYLDKDQVEQVEEQGHVTMDMMEKVAYSDRDETAYDPNFATSADGEIAERTWIVGLSLLTIQTAGRSGVSQVIRRRPSGTKYSIFKPSLTAPPKHQVPITHGLAADAFHMSSYRGKLPEDILQEMYSSLGLAVAPRLLNERPVVLPDDDSMTRALAVFDRNPTVDGHKVGIIYIGPGQSTEAEILANSNGSPDYTHFVQRLGTLTRLKGANFNTAGLDRSDDMDGEYTYCWRDRATEVVFHIITMMPTHPDTDPNSTAKKRHIGNDFVNVVWNNSGAPFQFDTFPSAFNYAYIVITPETQPSFGDVRHRPDEYFYRVQVLSAPGFPEISPAAEMKLLSARGLPDYIRLIFLNASVFCQVYEHRHGGEHTSPWRNRLREIKRLRDKHIINLPTPVEAPTSPLAIRPVSNLTSFGSSSNLGSMGLLSASRQIGTPSPVMLSSAMGPLPTLQSLHMGSTSSVPTLNSRATAGDHYGGPVLKERTHAQIQQRSSLATFHSLSEMSSAATRSRSSLSMSETDGDEDRPRI